MENRTSLRDRYPDFRFIGAVATNGAVCVERQAYNRFRVFNAPEPDMAKVVFRGTKMRHFRTIETALNFARKLGATNDRR